MIQKYECVGQIQKGDVVQLCIDNDQVKLMKSDGKCPLGIVSQKVKILDKKTKKIKRHAVKVFCGRQFIRTSNFDIKQRYPINAPVFINSAGQFTTLTSHVCVGFVTGKFDNEIELLWL